MRGPLSRGPLKIRMRTRFEPPLLKKPFIKIPFYKKPPFIKPYKIYKNPIYKEPYKNIVNIKTL